MDLKQMRLDKGLTQEDVANRVGVTRAAVVYWEKGQTPRVKYLPKLARVLGCSVEKLLRMYAG
ncbi:MAG: helix-turn-helix transcriptional regulator [Selenomonadaceae bacterium]|nr:helix-turn-helix domain-containing protein [Selenomonadaceae bacterium]MDY3915720.1 helix-turn-helix transcriptional regulator [Selenomonadaceae bacterium]